MAPAHEDSGVIDKRQWGPGPWQDEPDRQEWITSVGYPGMMVRHRRMGHWCAYIGISEGHPLYGLDARAVGRRVTVHGGVILAHRDSADGTFWIGFECANAEDISPALEAEYANVRMLCKRPEFTYKDALYVEEQCEMLAFQLCAIAQAPKRTKRDSS